MQSRAPAALFPLLLAALLAGLTFWLEAATRPQGGGKDGKLRHDPDYLVEDFAVRRFDPEGRLQHTLRAAEMRHYPDDDSTHVTAPALIYHATPPTRLEARTALLDNQGRTVTLLGEVRVTRAGAAGTAETVLTTAQLDVFPDDEVAISRAPAILTQGASHVSGEVLHANQKSALYVLEGSVRGVFHHHRGPTD